MSNFISNLLNKIGHFFEGLFNAAQHAWSKLEPDLQNAILQGSGIIDIINKNIDAAPPEVIALIQKAFPNLTTDKLKSALHEVNKVFNIASDIEDSDLEVTLSRLQKYLATFNLNNTWSAVSSTAAQILSTAFAPNGTPFAKISMLIEFVYNKFIKK